MSRHFAHLAIALSALCFLQSQAAAQPHAAPPAEMAELSFLLGEWDGEGWIVMGPAGRATFTIHESIRPELDGAIVVMQGRGVSVQDGVERVTHQAFGVLSYNTEAGRFEMRAYRAGGQYVDATVSVQETTMTWQIEGHMGAQVRFTIAINEQGRWVEEGHISRDRGESWEHFFQMTLDRTGG